MWSGWPWPSGGVIADEPVRPARAGEARHVAGRSSSELAKIAGMTPEVLSLSGRCELSPPNMRLPCLALGILDQDAAAAPAR